MSEHSDTSSKESNIINEKWDYSTSDEEFDEDAFTRNACDHYGIIDKIPIYSLFPEEIKIITSNKIESKQTIRNAMKTILKTRLEYCNMINELTDKEKETNEYMAELIEEANSQLHKQY